MALIRIHRYDPSQCRWLRQFDGTNAVASTQESVLEHAKATYSAMELLVPPLAVSARRIIDGEVPL